MNNTRAMYLEKTDTEMHLQKWTGSKSGKQTNANIITYLGMGIVSFKAPEQPADPSAYDYEFHTDTDVIVSFHLTNNTGSDIEYSTSTCHAVRATVPPIPPVGSMHSAVKCQSGSEQPVR